MTSYIWSISPGGVITSGTGTNSVMVTWITAGAQTISVNYTNINGCTATAPTVKNVTVNALPVPTITGSASVCVGTTGVNYSTETGMTGYIWNVSAGGTITSGNGTNVVTVTWNTAGAQTVSVIYTDANGCTAISPTIKNVIVNPVLCPNDNRFTLFVISTQTYVYTTEPGMSNYIWSVSAGGTITGGGTSTSHTVTVRWNTAGTQWVSVDYTNSYGCSAPTATVYPVIVNPVPVPTITGNNKVCAGTTGLVYTTQAGMINYTWNVSLGGTITAGGTSTSNTVTVTWNTAGSQSVSVDYSNTFGCAASVPATFNVTVSPLPVPTLTGPMSVCEGTAGNVYTTQAGMSNYSWIVSSGGTITAGGSSGSNTVTVTWNTPGAQFVSVNYNNANGCKAVSPTVLNVTVNTLPVPTISGPGTLCSGVAGVYTTETGKTNYTWTVSTGWNHFSRRRYCKQHHHCKMDSYRGTMGKDQLYKFKRMQGNDLYTIQYYSKSAASSDNHRNSYSLPGKYGHHLFDSTGNDRLHMDDLNRRNHHSRGRNRLHYCFLDRKRCTMAQSQLCKCIWMYCCLTSSIQCNCQQGAGSIFEWCLQSMCGCDCSIQYRWGHD